MYLMVKQQVKHLTKNDYLILRELSHVAKNLKNQAIYNIRQHYFKTGKHLSYCENNKLLKKSVNYKTLNSNMSQQLIKDVDESFKSYYGFKKSAKRGCGACKNCKRPHYLPKDGYTTLIIGFIRLNDNELILPYSNVYRKNHELVKIKMPPILNDKNIKEIRIVPKANARFFEIQYIYKVECNQRKLNTKNALAIDLGIDNLATAVTSSGKTFIIDGRKLKSINQWFNKENARLQSIKDKQKFGKKLTRRQQNLSCNRENKVNDYMNKTTRKLIDYCVRNDIGTLVVGYAKNFQRKSNIGKTNNQNFVNIPYGKLRKKLEYLCELNGITYIEQDESYTSKASFWDKDDIPTYNKDKPEAYTFSGKRIHRGLYKCSNGMTLNADVNGALNILRKCSVVDLTVLYSRGAVDTPVRIRIA